MRYRRIQQIKTISGARKREGEAAELHHNWFARHIVHAKREARMGKPREGGRVAATQKLLAGEQRVGESVIMR